MHDVKALTHIKTVSAIGLNESFVFPVKLEAFFEIDIKRNSLSIIRRNQKLLNFEGVPDYLWLPLKLELMKHLSLL